MSSLEKEELISADPALLFSGKCSNRQDTEKLKWEGSVLGESLIKFNLILDPK